MRVMRIIAVILLVATWLIIEGCAGTTEPPASKPISETTPTTTPISEPTSTPAVTTPAPEPAKFEVSSLFFEPPTAMAGDNITIKALVSNTGGSEGTYPATLTVDGVSVETREVTITAGDSQTITFVLHKEIPGTYQISVGKFSKTLLVEEKLIELKWDNGKADIGASPLTATGGFLVDFTPPSIPFIVKQIKIYGILRASDYDVIKGKDFTVTLWDKEHHTLHELAQPISRFTPINKSIWVAIDIPNVEVNDKFYVHFVAPHGTSQSGRISIAADNTTVNEHSYITDKSVDTYQMIKNWQITSGTAGWISDSSRINWMIRVIGTEADSK